MPITHLLSLVDLNTEKLNYLIERSVQFGSGSNKSCKPLSGKIVGIYFSKPSTRTRSSFTVAALKLGATTVAFGPQDLQVSTGETMGDTARVLSGYLDGLVMRTNESIGEMRIMASQNEMAIVNAMSENEHPTQALADLSAIKEYFGCLQDIHILYLGEGNNTAAALALAVALIPGMKITFVTPQKYGMHQNFLHQVSQLAEQNGSTIEAHHCMEKIPPQVDVVYTTRWQTMGVPHPDPNWRENFWPYRVTQELMEKVSKQKSPSTIFMHDLPAVRGEDVEDEVLDGQQSFAWRQARHKMFSAMALLEWCIVGSHNGQ